MGVFWPFFAEKPRIFKYINQKTVSNLWSKNRTFLSKQPCFRFEIDHVSKGSAVSHTGDVRAGLQQEIAVSRQH